MLDVLAFILAASSYREITDADKAAIRTTISSRLKDPESARFRWLSRTGADGWTYCGFVNAKNSFGGYVGFRPFQVMLVQAKGGSPQALFISMDSPATAKMCLADGISLEAPTTE